MLWTQRYLAGPLLLVVTFALSASAGNAAASPAPNLIVVKSGHTTSRYEPALRSSLGRATRKPPDNASRTKRSTRATPATASGPTLTGGVQDAYGSGAIDQETHDRYLDIYDQAISVWKSLSGTRKQNLGAVIDQAKQLARSGQLTVQRMVPVFDELDRNLEWWASKGAPASGQRVTFGDSPVIYQYYPGQGLRLQPLANCGAANGFWQSKKYDKLKSLLDELMAMRVDRTVPSGTAFSTLEYYFPFGGGKAPWFSAMTQATCIQALARASSALGDPSYNQIAESMLPAFQINATSGARIARSGGSWYLLYNFAPGQLVLNGHLQALIGLFDFNQLTGNQNALTLFNEGDRAAKAVLGQYDTGAWSLYQPGKEADLNYHTLQRDFLSNLCKRTNAPEYCQTADRFTAYLTQPPIIGDVRATPPTVKSRATEAINFNLSKISKVGLAVKNSSGATVYSTAGQIGYGKRKLLWKTPAAASGTYSFTLTATDLAGNVGASASGSLTVARRK